MADEAKHLEQLSEVEAQRAKDNPDDERQQTKAANAIRDAISMRVRARKMKEAAQQALADKAKAATRAKELAKSAAAKMDWAQAEEAKRDEWFDGIKGKGSGITNEQADAIRAAQSAAGKEQALYKIAAKVRELAELTRQRKVADGLISKDTADAWKAKYQNYADLRGWEDKDLAPDDSYFAGPSGRKMNIKGEESKKAFGRTSISENPIVNMFDAAHRAIERGEANKAGQTLYNALTSFSDEQLDGLVKLHHGDAHMEQDKLTGLARPVQDSRFVMDPRAVAVKFNGNARYMVFDDAKLAESVKRLAPDAVGKMGRFVIAYQNLAKQMWTHLAPAFMVRHFLGRYPMEGMLNAGEHGLGAMARAWKSYPVFGAYHQAVKAADGMDIMQRIALAQKVANGTATKAEQYQAYYHEMREEGGLMGRNFTGLENIANDIASRLLTIGDVKNAKGLPAKIATAGLLVHAKDKAAMAAMDHVTGNMDAAQRLAAYIEARMRGLSKTQAALEAREATVDFTMRGEATNKASMWKTFFNVAVQTGWRMGSRWKALAGVLAGVTAAGFANTMVNALLGGMDDDGKTFYEKTPSWERQSNIVVLNPFARDRKGRPGSVKIPLPYNYALPFNVGASIAGEILKAMGVGKEKHGEILGRAFRSALDALSPLGSDETWGMLAPTVTEPIMHVLQNKTFSGSPLHNDSEFSAVAASEQGRTNTPAHWKGLAKLINSVTGGNRYQSGGADPYPESLREVLGFVTEAQERTAAQIIDAVHSVQNGQMPDLGKVPGPNVFIGAKDQMDRADEAAWYDAKRESDLAKREVAKADKEGNGAMISPEQRNLANQDKGFTQLNSASKKSTGILHSLNAMQQSVRESQTMSGAEKQAEIQRLEQRKADIMHNFLLRGRQ